MVLKRHPCLRCEYEAKKKSHLQTHVKSVHEDEKFQCSHCGSKFTQKGSLQGHMKSVHEGQKFHCSHCGSKFSCLLIVKYARLVVIRPLLCIVYDTRGETSLPDEALKIDIYSIDLL